ncbi:putative mitochondrial hypothetical protein [Leptomonas pyrrhocoris]|uniref:tRNA/rRNA methyltransferase SpoU type domain-containing protein n=1 Tax=Leptomonas pyrrhocoris TaxID=157538 RepID=A0A0M9GAP8_LEPPY|nr:putative mitochondrial hypothetical protein [Leptomonas pyrrhocoris]KPA86289.1 putative mitochondrial hypothetical protein [Leptomonas pyrrhocoris]|eukprot:XP_015664728.1 putative mitochondrial hypothetical protein [Leptomonas pyrrhocoris]
MSTLLRRPATQHSEELVFAAHKVHIAKATVSRHVVSRRFQSFIGEQRSVARISKASYRHPLAPKDPSQRNVAISSTAVSAAVAAASGRSSSSSSSSTFSHSLSAEDLKKRAQKALLLQLQQDVLWEGTVIDDTNNRLVQHFMKLSANEKYRQARRMLVVGGRAMIEELCQAGFRPRHLMVNAGRPIPDWANDQEDTDVVLVDRKVAEAVAPGTDGYVGDFEIPPPPMKEHLIANHQRLNRVLVLDNVDDPGVLGTLLRTASGFQYDAIITTNHCADLYDHRVIRAARGAHFQTSVPIYTLKEEDGDDVYGLLNHMVERNNLLPLCYAAQEDSADASVPAALQHTDGTTAPAGGRVYHSSVVGASPVVLPTFRQSSSAYAAKVVSTSQCGAVPRTPLSDFCLDRFTRLTGAADDDRGGYVLFAGPNHKRNMMHRLTTRVARPTTQLLLDCLPAPTEAPSDLLISMSVVLHALRPRGNWDYLPVEAKQEQSSVDLQVKRASVDIGVNRLQLSVDDINLDEAEQREKAHLANEFMRWRRLSKRCGSDYEHWMDAEQGRVQGMMKDDQQRRTSPWLTKRARKTRPMPDWVPNIIDEYRQSLGRDALSHEREVSAEFRRPPPRT